jgi:hypothetical protein
MLSECELIDTENISLLSQNMKFVDVILLISNNVEFVRYCGGHFENGDQ